MSILTILFVILLIGWIYRLGCVSCGRWLDPHSVDRGADFVGAALRSRPERGLNPILANLKDQAELHSRRPVRAGIQIPAWVPVSQPA